MKSSLLSIVLLLVGMVLPIQIINAQQAKNYQFVYIDHEINTPVNQLCKRLKELYDFAEQTDDVLIIYLSTGLPSDGNCMLSLKNLKDVTEKNLLTIL